MTRTDTVCTVWAFALFRLVLPSVKSDYHWNPIEFQRSSTTEAEQRFAFQQSLMLQEIFPHYCERFSFLLIKCCNDSRMLWAAVVPMIVSSPVIKSIQQFTSADPSAQHRGSAGRCCQGWLQLWGCLVANSGAGSNLQEADSAKEEYTYHYCVSKLFFFFLSSAALESSLWKCKCCVNSSVQADENVW